MNTSTRLSTGLLLLVGLVGAGCGGDDDKPPGADAGVDAGADGSPLGEWKLASLTDLNGTVTDVDTDVGGVQKHVNGTLVLDATGIGEYAAILVAGGRPDFGTIVATSGTTMLADDLSAVTIGGDPFTMMYLNANPESLLLSTLDGTSSYEYRRLVAAPVESIDVTGRASIQAGTPALTAPRVALLGLRRGAGGSLDFVRANDVEPTVDVALPGFGAAATDTADFTVKRTMGALGFEAIHFGTSGAAIAVSVLVAYEDRDHDNLLTRFAIDDCASAGVDCIRGISPLVLAYRTGDSAELQAAGFGLLRTGWAVSVVADDNRTTLTTLVPLDPTNAPLPFDVQFALDPSSVLYPTLDFGAAP